MQQTGEQTTITKRNKIILQKDVLLIINENKLQQIKEK